MTEPISSAPGEIYVFIKGPRMHDSRIEKVHAPARPSLKCPLDLHSIHFQKILLKILPIFEEVSKILISSDFLNFSMGASIYDVCAKGGRGLVEKQTK